MLIKIYNEKQDSSLIPASIKATVAGSMTKSYRTEGGSQVENSRLCVCVCWSCFDPAKDEEDEEEEDDIELLYLNLSSPIILHILFIIY